MVSEFSKNMYTIGLHKKVHSAIIVFYIRQPLENF